MGVQPPSTATATATGEDGSVSVDLSVPKSMGGPSRPNTTTPEHRFAAGYAACFAGALDCLAAQQKRTPRTRS